MPYLFEQGGPGTPVPPLIYDFCGDWLIFATDADGERWYVVTECWEEWLDLPDDADQESNAIERYMLPIAREQWYDLPWKPVSSLYGD